LFPTCAPAGLSSAPAKQPQHPRHWRSPCAKRWVPVREVPVGLHDSNTLGARLGSQCAHNAGCQHDRASASLLITPSLPHHPAGSLLSLCSCGCSNKLGQHSRLHPPARRPFDRFAARRAKQQGLCTAAQSPEFSKQRCFTDCSCKQGELQTCYRRRMRPARAAAAQAFPPEACPAVMVHRASNAAPHHSAPCTGYVSSCDVHTSQPHLLPHPCLALDPSYFGLTAQLAASG